MEFNFESLESLLSRIESTIENRHEELALEAELTRLGYLLEKIDCQLKTDRSIAVKDRSLIQNIVFYLPGAVAVVDRDMNYIAVSQQWIKDYRLEKLDVSDIIGRNHSEVLPEITARWRQDYQDCLTGKVEHLSREDVSVGDDNVDYLHWQIYPWRENGGGIGGLLMFSEIITDQKQLLQKIESTEGQMRAVFAGMNELVFTYELNSDSILILPTKFFEIYQGAIADEIITQTQDKLLQHNERDFQRFVRQVIDTQNAVDFEYSLQLDSSIVWFSVNISPISPSTVIWIARDISDRKKKVQDLLYAEKELAQVTLQSIGDAVITTDAVGKIEYINPIAEKLTGWKAQEAKHKLLDEVLHLVHESTKKPIVNPIKRVTQQNKACQLTAKNLLIACNGNRYAIEGLVSPIKDRENKMIGTVIVFRDVTSARTMARRLSWQAAHDPLTKLLNRRRFEHYLAAAIKDTNENEAHHALCFFDLDRFKVVNDSCGHAAGDRLLRQLTSLLKKRIRNSDIFARVGGDEFGLLLHRCPLHVAYRIANQLRQSVEDFRFVCDTKVFRIGASIGLVEIKSTTESLTTLLSAADAACYVAKQQGGNHVHLCEEGDLFVAQQQGERQWIEKINLALEENFSLDARVNTERAFAGSHRSLDDRAVAPSSLKETGRALPSVFLAPSPPELDTVQQSAAGIPPVEGTPEPLRGSHRFCLYAQKIVAIVSERHPVHYEILLRMKHSSGELILPGAFLPAAERYGLMPAIDRWVISTFFANYEAYCQSQATQIDFSRGLYTINLSGASINSQEFGNFLRSQFAQYQIPPETICFEITETVAITNFENANTLIGQLKDIGCSIALDDFGSGMSSLTYLKNLPIDYLKIDGSFVTNIANDEVDYATVECFNHISKIMNIATIAEFVENKAILQNLRQIGIDYAQGYGIERPQPLVWES